MSGTSGSDLKHFHIQGNITVSPNENNIADIGEGVLRTNFIKETTDGAGVTLIESVLNLRQLNSNTASLSFESSILQIQNTHGSIDLATLGGGLSLLSNGDVNMTGSLSIAGGLTALSGQHLLQNTSSGQGVLVLRNTSPGGYSSIGFFDDINTQRISFGIGNSTSATNTSEAFLNILNGFDFRVKMGLIDTLKLNANGTIQVFKDTTFSSTNASALTVAGGVTVGGVMNLTGTTSSTSTITGALVVSGGVGVTGNVYTGGLVRITNTTASGLTTTGAVVVSGGIGIGGALNVAGNGTFHNGKLRTAFSNGFNYIQSGSVDYSPSSTELRFGGTYTGDYWMSVNSTQVYIIPSTASTSTTTGALRVTGGVGIGGAVYLGSPLNMVHVTAPAAPVSGVSRCYTDNSDGLLKSVSSSMVVTTYQPTNTKGDITAHNGTTQVRLPVDAINDSYLISNSSTPTGLSWFNKAYAYIRDEKTPGTNGGSTTTGAWFTKVLNTATYYPPDQTFISLDTGTNLITVQPGVYYIQVSSPAVGGGNHTCRIADLTEFVVLINGTAERAQSGGFLGTGEMSSSTACGIVTAVVPKLLRIDHRVDVASGVGRGLATGFQTEVYTTVQIYKI